MKIYQAITEAATDFETKTGSKPEGIHLGEEEMTALIRWAMEEQYIPQSDDPVITGMHRPEVSRLPVYKVNIQNHLRVF